MLVEALDQLPGRRAVLPADRPVEIDIGVRRHALEDVMVRANGQKLGFQRLRLLGRERAGLHGQREVCRHEAREHAVADVRVFPVVEAEAEEEIPGGVGGGLLDEDAAEVQGGGVEDGAAGKVARDVRAVVVDEALELLDGGGEGVAKRAVRGGERT